jgi:hypothetical protein
MTQNPNPNLPLQTALDHAHTLAGSRQTQTTNPHWVAQAGHVGDLSVLALALRS